MILSFDFGTSGLKTIVLDRDGKILSSAYREYPLFVPELNYAEQDPNYYWKSACETAKEVIGKARINALEIKGLSMCTQGMGLIPIDDKGTVLCNNITWLDNRAGKQAKEINERLGESYATSASVVAKILWINENVPDLYNKTKWFLDVTGFIVYKLTGKVCMELTNSSPYSLDDNQSVFKARLYNAAKIDVDKMPPLVICGSFVGNVNEKAASELGITNKTNVFMGSGDVPASAAGAACVKPGDAHICLASSGWFSALTDTKRLKSLSPGIYQIYSINKNVLLYGGGVQSVGTMIDYIIKQFYRKDYEEKGNGIYRFLSGELKKTSPGSAGLTMTPWLCGESCPISDENVKAVFLGVTNRHDRAHFLRASMESVIYSLRWQIEYYKNDTGQIIDSLSVVGSCAQNSDWMQITSDILGTSISVPENVSLSGAVGAGIIAAVGLGYFSYEEGKEFVRFSKIYYPQFQDTDTYSHSYSVFKSIYSAIKPLYEIMDINQANT
jgi:xylulokinase